jgi:pyruvate formate lyase activating enzyme
MEYRIKGFLETSFSDWPGKMASVLFLPSCNFRCPYCHNYELVLQPEKFANFPWELILEDLKKRQGWIDGVCLTGGEPTLHPWLPPLIRELRSMRSLTPSGEPMGIKLDTNGTHPEVLHKLIDEGLLDYVAMDLKAPLEAARYSLTTGVPMEKEQMDRVQSSIQILLRGKVDYEFRTTVVSTLIEEEEIYTLARQIRGAPRYTLQNFNPRDTLDEKLRKVAPVDPALLHRMQRRVNEIIQPAEFGARSPEWGAKGNPSLPRASTLRLPTQCGRASNPPLLRTPDLNG